MDVAGRCWMYGTLPYVMTLGKIDFGGRLAFALPCKLDDALEDDMISGGRSQHQRQHSGYACVGGTTATWMVAFWCWWISAAACSTIAL